MNALPGISCLFIMANKFLCFLMFLDDTLTDFVLKKLHFSVLRVVPDVIL